MDEESLFHTARELPQAERGAFVRRQCAGDAGLRQRLEALLAAHEDVAFLSVPVADVRGQGSGGEAARPPVVDRYRVLEQVGEGGMGEVYRAEQLQPVRRLVALKVLKAGLAGGFVAARFAAERQALARMDHPNVARVFDAGTAADGRPFVAMELVEGVPLTRFCDGRRLPLRARLALFVQVCHGVQHAHQKGVVHRDLKPSNVLVGRADAGASVPKVIDFGVAKAVGGKLTEETLATAFGMLVGTLDYMSPEQAELDAADVDTRSDVYALGVLLFELLTGTTPVAGRRATDTTALELLRSIREEEPVLPSAQVVRLPAAARVEVAAVRAVEPGALAATLRGDLDWIASKAMARERERRYQTAGELAADVQRHLDDEPVLAGPPSWTYRLRKFARRRRGLLHALVACALLLLAGTAVSAWQALRATAARHAAVASEQQVFDVLRAMTDNVVERWMARQAVLDAEDREFLEGVLEQYGRLAHLSGDPRRSLLLRAEGAHRVARIRERLGGVDAARAGYEQAGAWLEELLRGEPDNAQGRELLARTLHAHAGLSWDGGDRPLALAKARRAIAELRALGGEGPLVERVGYDLVRFRITLASMLGDGGAADAAEGELRAAQDLAAQLVASRPEEPRLRSLLAVVRQQLAEVLGRRGLHAEAEHAVAAAITDQRTLLAAAPASPELRVALAASLRVLALQLLDTQRAAAARGAAAEAARVLRQLATEFPTVTAYRTSEAQCRRHLAKALAALGDAGAARAESVAAIALYEGLEAAERQASDTANLAAARRQLGDLLKQDGALDEAEREYRAAIELLEEVLAASQVGYGQAVELAACECNLANLIAHLRGDPAAALPWFDRAVARLDALGAAAGPAVAGRQFLHTSLLNRAQVRRRLGQDEPAFSDLGRAAALAPAGRRAELAMLRVRWLLGADAGAALRELETLLAGAGLPPHLLCQAALVLCQAARAVQSPRHREAWAAQAVQLLERAHRGGHFADGARFAELRSSAVLQVLRGREDFARLEAAITGR